MDEFSVSPRRRWLIDALSAAVAVTVAVIAFPVLWFVKPRKTGSSTASMEAVAPYRADQLLTDPDGEWVPPFEFGGKPCLLIKTTDGKIKAFNAICTHTDCTVKFRPREGDIFCNCHNGVFDTSGQNVSGPPPRPLQEFKVTLRGKPGQEQIIVSRS